MTTKLFSLYKPVLEKIENQKTSISLILVIIIICAPFYQVIFKNKTLTTGIFSTGVMAGKPSENFIHPREIGKVHIRDKGGSAWQDEPLTFKVASLYNNGLLPLWNSNAGFGKPLAADMMSMAFSIVRIPAFIRPTVAMIDFTLILRYILGGIFMYLYLKRLELSNPTSVCGSIAFILSGYFFYYQNMGHLNVEVFLPLLLYAIERINRQESFRNFLILIVALVFMLTGGHPESMMLSLLLGTFYFLLRTMTGKKNLSRRMLQKGSILTLGLVIAVGLTSFLIIPFLEYYLNSDIGIHDAAHNLHAKGQSVQNFFLQFFPIITQNLGRSLVYNYWASLTLFFVIIGAFNKKYRKIYFPLFFLLLIIILKVCAPSLFIWLKFVPILNSFAFRKYLHPQISLLFATLAAIGLEKTKPPPRNVEWVSVLGSASFLPPKSRGREIKQKGTIPSVFFFVFFILQLILVPFIYYQAFDKNFQPGFIKSYMTLTSILLILLAANLIQKMKILKKFPLVYYAACLLIVIELIVVAPKNRPPRGNPYAETNFTSFLLQNKEPFRTYSTDRLLFPATNSVYGIDDIRDIHAAYPKNYISYIKNFVKPDIIDRFSRHSSTVVFQNNPLFDLTNTKFILALTAFDDSKANQQFKLVYQDEILIYENINAFPRAFIVKSIIPVTSEKVCIKEIKKSDFNPKEEAILIVKNASELENFNLDKKTNSGQDEVVFQNHGDLKVELSVSSTEGGLLVLTDSFYPGWQAYIDNKKTEIYQTNLAFRGVFISPGEHQVIFKYQPFSYILGVCISTVSLIFLLYLKRRFVN